MTDRIRHLTITLAEDTRDDDVASIVSAIEHIRGVASVALNIVKAEDHLARMSVRAEVRAKLHDAIEGVFRQRELHDKLKER